MLGDGNILSLGMINCIVVPSSSRQGMVEQDRTGQVVVTEVSEQEKKFLVTSERFLI